MNSVFNRILLLRDFWDHLDSKVYLSCKIHFFKVFSDLGYLEFLIEVVRREKLEFSHE